MGGNFANCEYLHARLRRASSPRLDFCLSQDESIFNPWLFPRGTGGNFSTPTRPPFWSGRACLIPCRFHHTKKTPPIWRCSCGGTDGNRTRVRRLLHTTFSVDSQSFRIPTSGRRQTGSRQGSFLCVGDTKATLASRALLI